MAIKATEGTNHADSSHYFSQRCADLKEMLCDSLQEFEDQFRHQLDNGVVTDDGGAGSDWMSEYQLEIVKV